MASAFFSIFYGFSSNEYNAYTRFFKTALMALRIGPLKNKEKISYSYKKFRHFMAFTFFSIFYGFSSNE